MVQAVRTIDLAAWKAMSAEERELLRLDDAIAALETAEAERRAPEPANLIVAEIAERAAVPRRQVARVMDAMRELLAERAAARLRSD